MCECACTCFRKRVAHIIHKRQLNERSGLEDGEGFRYDKIGFIEIHGTALCETIMTYIPSLTYTHTHTPADKSPRVPRRWSEQREIGELRAWVSVVCVCAYVHVYECMYVCMYCVYVLVYRWWWWLKKLSF